MNILVTGGAGYIGSHMVKLLGERGRHVLVVDDLSTGHRDPVPGAHLIEADIGERGRMATLLADARIGAVMHFAASSLVAESVADPEKYRQNNVTNTLSLLDAMLEAGVKRFVFSSSASGYREAR